MPGTERLHALAHPAEIAFRSVVIGLAIYGGLHLVRSAMAQDGMAYLPIAANAQEVESIDQRVAALEDLLVHVGREGNDIYVTGANLHVVNGTGATHGVTNSLGNLIIGYNEPRAGRFVVNDRSGSHMLVVGSENNYSGLGGIVSGFHNSVSGAWASVSGGAHNVASGTCATVSGGYSNNAAGPFTSVAGGTLNAALGEFASLGGGLNRQVTEKYNWRAGDLFQER